MTRIGKLFSTLTICFAVLLSQTAVSQESLEIVVYGASGRIGSKTESASAP